MDFQSFLAGYIECLLWSETDDQSESGDGNFQGRDDRLTKAARAEIEADCRAFWDAEQADLTLYMTERDAAHAGHDFCLTRNGHGVGFWDRGMGALGDRLSAACKSYGPQGLYAARGWLYVA